MNTPEQRRKKFQLVDNAIKDLYDSKTANALNEEMKIKYNISEEKNSDYLHLTGDVILGFNKIAELPSLFQSKVGLSKEDALRLTADLTDAWGPIVEREAAEAEAKKAAVGELADKIAAITPTSEAGGATEKVVVATPPTADIETKRAHGYGALAENSADSSVSLAGEPIVQSTSQLDIQKEAGLSPGATETKQSDTV